MNMEHDEEENGNLAAINTSVLDKAVFPILCNADTVGVNATFFLANMLDLPNLTPPPSLNFKQEWPRSVPLSPTLRTRLRPRFA